MSRLDQFAERIETTMSNLTEARLVEQAASAAEMARAEEARQRYTPLADAIHHLEVRPRLDVLLRHFPNASVEHWLAPTGLYSHCAFARTAQYPASVKLTLGIVHDTVNGQTAMQYKLSVVPLLFQFESADELAIDPIAPDMADIVDWLEAKLQLFLDTYLRIESDPSYQRENQQIDPVCGMHVQAAHTPHTHAYAHRTYRFCSRECLERFTSSPAFFLGDELRPLTTATVAPPDAAPASLREEGAVKAGGAGSRRA